MLEKGHRQSGLPDSYEGDILTTYERNIVNSEYTLYVKPTYVKMKSNFIKEGGKYY